MEIYLVGGAVRDELLGLPVRERDWVVVGATPEELESRGFTPVGKDFPVFLHPETMEEYALARTERKTGPGYHGFEVHAAPDVTLEQDLGRRDLTINAMARDADGRLVDPWGGHDDLEARLLRHISPAFREDPLRVLRVARFAARFASLGFAVADETRELMREMVASGELEHLAPERVWREIDRALGEPQPTAFFEVLHDCAGLVPFLPELSGWLDGEGASAYPLRALRVATGLTEHSAIRFAALLQAALTDHPPARVDELCAALRAPNEYRDLTRLAHGHREAIHGAEALDAESLMEILETLDAFRRPGRVEDVLTVCRADALARAEPPATSTTGGYPGGDRLRQALAAAESVDTRSIAKRDLAGPEIGEAIRQARIEAIAHHLSDS